MICANKPIRLRDNSLYVFRESGLGVVKAESSILMQSLSSVELDISIEQGGGGDLLLGLDPLSLEHAKKRIHITKGSPPVGKCLVISSPV